MFRSSHTHSLWRILSMAIVLAMLLTPLAALAQEEQPHATATADDLMKVNILFVGAHPDDDSTATATMARYALDRGAKVGVITATKGEGGGNAIGRQLGESLGMVREAEERKALGMLGIDHVFYLGEEDWAFTTSANAAQEFWGYEEPLGRLVRMYRVMKPDVVITMNPSPRGHGHHQYIAKLATEAFFMAGDPEAFPEQIEEEFIEPWQPKKLYYALAYGAADLQASLAIPTNEYSPSAFATYGDLEAIALSLYRSQGFDASYQVPVTGNRLNPETFTLAASILPIPENEQDLLAGITSGVDTAPANVELVVNPAEFYVGQGTETEVEVIFRNYSEEDLTDVSLSLEVPEGWTAGEASAPAAVAMGEAITHTFSISVPETADVEETSVLVGHFDATDADGDAVYASKRALVQVTPPVSVELQPIEAVQIFRDWAREQNLEHLIRLVPAEIAVGAGEEGEITVVLNNRTDEDRAVDVSLTMTGTQVSLGQESQNVTVAGGEMMTVPFSVTVPADMMQTSFPISVTLSYDGYELSDSGTFQVVPTLDVPQIAEAPTIDGDLSEFADLPSYEIPATNLWEGETTGASDLTGSFRVSYDDEFLYVAVEVQDDTVVSNIAPNDIKGHWRSDSVEITVDPQGPGVSEHTLTTFKTGIFPFDTEGNVQAERDADANQGIISETAPDMQVASAETDQGYALEVAIPWNAVPGEVQPGDSFGFNVLLYDCDKADASVGENCNEARTAWSAWSQIQGNPRLWGHATLEP